MAGGIVATVTAPANAGERGFSLLEVLVAMLILTAGLLPLAGLFAVAVRRMTASTPQLVAREKAREAIESVHSARDTGEFSWATIQNKPTGVFLTGEQDIRDPGADGLVNTTDDAAAAIQLPAGEYRREIVITPLIQDGSESQINLNLRQIKVIVKYKVGGIWNTYTLTTYISAYS